MGNQAEMSARSSPAPRARLCAAGQHRTPGVSMRIRMADERGSLNFLSVPSSKQLLTLYMEVNVMFIFSVKNLLLP